MEQKLISQLDKLNEIQLEIVKIDEGAVLVSAGIGTGKTEVLMTKLAYLIHNGTDPSKIIAVTFTNEAAKSMKRRSESISGQKID